MILWDHDQNTSVGYGLCIVFNEQRVLLCYSINISTSLLLTFVNKLLKKSKNVKFEMLLYMQIHLICGHLEFI
jgi:hypothetical protein